MVWLKSLKIIISINLPITWNCFLIISGLLSYTPAIVTENVAALLPVNTNWSVCKLRVRDSSHRNENIALRKLRERTGLRLQMPQTILFIWDYLVWKHWWPLIWAQIHIGNHWSSGMIAGKLHSVNPCLITSAEISAGLPAIPSYILLPRDPYQMSLVGFWRHKFCSFLFLTFLPRRILREVDVKTRDVQGCEEYKHLFFIVLGVGGGGGGGGDGGENGSERWGL